MRALLDQGFKCPQPVLNIYGQDKSIEKIYYECEEGDGNQQHTDLNGIYEDFDKMIDSSN